MTRFEPGVASEVIAGVDCSSRSIPVLQWADDYAQLIDGQLIALTAWGDGLGEAGGADDPAVVRAVPQALAASVAVALAKDRAAAARLCAVPETPLEALTIGATDAAIVVVGAHHMHPLLPLGSVTAQVIGAARCPIAVVRKWTPVRTGKIVVGVDGSAASRPALRWAVAHARRTGAKVEALLAWQWQPEFGVFPYSRPVEALHQEHEEIVRAEIAHLPQELAGLVHTSTADGRPADCLLEAAEGADLLVVGSHGHGPIASRLLGSVSQRVVRRSAAPVVVVPSRTAD